MDWITNITNNYGVRQIIFLSIPYIVGLLIMIYKAVIIEKNPKTLIFILPLFVQVLISALAYVLNYVNTEFSTFVIVSLPMLLIILLQITIYFKFLTLHRISETKNTIFSGIVSILVPFIYLYSILIIGYSILFRPFITELLFIIAIFYIPSILNLFIYKIAVFQKAKN